MGAIKTLIAYAGVVVAIYYALVLGYRILLHPLRKYPGPAAAKLSDAYSGFFAAQRVLHFKTYQNHLKYGSVFRQGPNRLEFNTAKALQDIYRNEAITKSYVYEASQPTQHNTFVTTDKTRHRQQRKLISPILSEQSMRAFEPVMVAQITEFLRQLRFAAKQQDGGGARPVDMAKACRYLTLDVVGHLGFGYDLRLQTEPTHRYLLRALNFGNYRVNLCMQFPFLTKLRPDVLANLLPSSRRTKLLAILQTMIRARLAQPVDAQRDLLSSIAQRLGLDFEQIPYGSLWTEAFMFFPAGGETIAGALSAAFFYLSRNEAAYRKLAAEIRSAFATGADIRSGPTLSGCRYLRACLDEALRMSPPIPGTLWRAAAASKAAVVVDGHVVPPGTEVGVNIYSLHHNPRYYPEPFVFRPERWLQQPGEEGEGEGEGDGEGKGGARARARPLSETYEAFAPFSVGPRGCAGKAMAYLEASLILARTIWYFDFEPAPGPAGELGSSKKNKKNTSQAAAAAAADEPDLFQIFDIFAASYEGPNLVFRPRGNVCDELDI